MLASQLLYTSWKNGSSTTKGYMVYSKSKDITDVEETEICAVMSYEAPDDLPYTPTDEEIETLFPKKIAYFQLSSGRFCLAQSSYVGQDYTNRWGNYLIHAFVLDDMGDLVPSKMCGSDIFRTRLTEEELNAEAAPEFLPQIEIENKGIPLTEQEVKDFFSSSRRKEVLKSLAQSVCEAVSNKTRIVLYDDLSNMRTWVTALSMVLPGNILNRVYFSTYAKENSHLITLSCQASTAASYMHSQSYLPNDLVCIDANQYNESAVTIGCYVDAVCNRLIDGYYDGILCSNSVNKLMLEYGCADFDLAYKLTYVPKGELDTVSSNEELVNIIEELAKHEAVSAPDCFDNIFSQYSNSEMYRGDASSFAVLKALYPRISTESKTDLLMMYVDGKLEEQSDAVVAYEEIKRDCPCEWEDAVMHFLRQSFQEHLERRLSNASVLLCNSWISVYSRCNEEQKQRACEQISALFKKQVATRDMSAHLCVLESCKSVDEKLYFSVYQSVCQTMEETIGADDAYLFQYLKLSLDYGDLFWNVLLQALKIFPTLEHKYVEHFFAFQEQFGTQMHQLMGYAEQNSLIRQFIDHVSIYAFENASIESYESLIACYTKYVANSSAESTTADQCKDIFVQKVKSFLNRCDQKDSVKHAVALYTELYHGREHVGVDKNLLRVLFETVYNDDQKSIAFISKCLSKTPFETITGFMNLCQDEGIDIYPRALLLYEGHYFEKATEKDGRSAQRVLQKMYDEKSYTFLSKTCSESLLREFLDTYMCAVLKGMYTIYKENEDLSASDLIDYFLLPISKAYNRFGEDILKAWKEDMGSTNENISIYFLYVFEKTNAFQIELKGLLEEYLVRIGKGKRNAVFEKLADYFKDLNDDSYSKKMDKYIKEFNKNHVSFWDKITNIFSVRDEDRSNGKKK